MSIKVSVLLSVYNSEPTVAGCIESVLRNTLMPDCELVIVDDASTDKSVPVIERVLASHAEGRCRLLRNEVNRGIGTVRQALLDAAEGEYVIFVDSDDWVEPSYLAELYDAAKKGNLDVVTCDAFIHFPDATSQCTLSLPADRLSCMRGFLDHSVGCYLWAKMFRTVFVREHGISFVPGLDIQEDLVFCARAFRFPLAYGHVDMPLYHYSRLGTASLTNRKGLLHSRQLLAAHTTVRDDLRGRGTELYKSVRHILRRKIARLRLSVMKQLLLRRIGE